MKEIERKYLLNYDVFVGLDRRPTQDKVNDIKQTYLYSDSNVELRVRQKGFSYYFTAKYGSGLVREEIEFPIDSFQFDKYSKDRPMIEKLRWVYGRWELDQFVGNLKGLALAEIELNDENEVVEFPEWLAPYVIKEVTYDEKYKNKNLIKTTYAV